MFKGGLFGNKSIWEADALIDLTSKLLFILLTEELDWFCVDFLVLKFLNAEMNFVGWPFIALTLGLSFSFDERLLTLSLLATEAEFNCSLNFGRQKLQNSWSFEISFKHFRTFLDRKT